MAKLIGEKCIINCFVNNVANNISLDIGVPVSLVSRHWSTKIIQIYKMSPVS